LHCCCAIQLRSDRSLRDELQICEPLFVDSIAPRSGLLASRREVLQLTSCVVFTVIGRLSAFVVWRHTFLDRAVGGVPVQQRLMSGYDKPIAGHGKFRRAKSCSSAGPAASSLPREDKNLLREMKMVPLPVGAWPNRNWKLFRRPFDTLSTAACPTPMIRPSTQLLIVAV
jgi:hypothetical protein